MACAEIPFFIQNRDYSLPVAQPPSTVTNFKVLPNFRVALILSDDSLQIWSVLQAAPKCLSTIKLDCSIKKMILMGTEELLLLSKKNSILSYRIAQEEKDCASGLKTLQDLPFTPLQTSDSPQEGLEIWQNCNIEEFPTQEEIFCLIEKRFQELEYAFYISLFKRKPNVSQAGGQEVKQLDIKKFEYKAKLSSIEILPLSDSGVVIWSQLQSTVDSTDILFWNGDKEWKQQLKEKNFGTLVTIKEGRPGYLLFFFNLNGGKSPIITEFNTSNFEQTTRNIIITTESSISQESGFWISDVMCYDEARDVLFFEYSNFSLDLKKIVCYQLSKKENGLLHSFDIDEDDVFLFESREKKYGVKLSRNWYKKNEDKTTIDLSAMYLIPPYTYSFYYMQSLKNKYGEAIIQDCINVLLK